MDRGAGVHQYRGFDPPTWRRISRMRTNGLACARQVPPIEGPMESTTTPGPQAADHPDYDRMSVELSSHRTGMSFQRTRMSADRTLMSVVRTSLALIGFGFTIFQVFQKLLAAQVVKSAAAPRRFGETLVLLGIGMLVVGIGYHIE